MIELYQRVAIRLCTFALGIAGGSLKGTEIECEREATEILALLREEVEQMVIPYMRGSYYYSGAEGFKQQVLALLRGDNETIS